MYVTDPKKAEAGDIRTPKHLADVMVALLDGNAHWVESEKSWRYAVPSEHAPPGIWRKDVDRSVRSHVMHHVLMYHPKASKAFVDGIEDTARTLLAINPNVFDKHPWLLGVGNGVVDLRTGQLQTASADDYITRAAPTDYVPGASRKLWLAHLMQVFKGDLEHISYFQKAVGAALVGDSNQKPQNFIYLIGPEGGGKGAMFRAITRTLGEGDHVATMAAGDLTERGFERHKQWMVRFKDSRLAIVEEVKRQELDVSKLKSLTGGDTQIANSMRQDDITWTPTHTLFMTSNDPPDFGGDVTGMWRRYRPMPTGDTIEAVAGYEVALASEVEGILAWAIEGTQLWLEEDNGADIPMSDEMKRMQEEHITHNDEFGELLDNGWLVLGPGCRASRKDVRESYLEHLRVDQGASGIVPVDKQDLTRLYDWVGRQPGVRALGVVRWPDGRQDRGFDGVEAMTA
jgi:P4 family phage/plasmid primase-like protien